MSETIEFEEFHADLPKAFGSGLERFSEGSAGSNWRDILWAEPGKERFALGFRFHKWGRERFRNGGKRGMRKFVAGSTASNFFIMTEFTTDGEMACFDHKGSEIAEANNEGLQSLLNLVGSKLCEPHRVLGRVDSLSECWEKPWEVEKSITPWAMRSRRSRIGSSIIEPSDRYSLGLASKFDQIDLKIARTETPSN